MIAIVGLCASRWGLAAPVMVDFSVLTEEVDITINLNFDGYPLDGVTFSYDNFGLEGMFAHMNNSGVHGSIGGVLIFNFETPIERLSFDFSVAGVESSAAPLLEGLVVILSYRQAEVTNLTVAADAFTAYPADPLHGDASGRFAHGGDVFDQAILFFPTGENFSVTNVVYEVVSLPSMKIEVMDQIARLTINDATGMVNGIDFSTNLVDWTTIAVITNLTGVITYDATNVPDSSLEFFRCYR